MLIDLRRLAGALRWRADVLIDLLRRIIPPLRRRPSVARPATPARRGAAQPHRVRIRAPSSAVTKPRRATPFRRPRHIVRGRGRVPTPQRVAVPKPRRITPVRGVVRPPGPRTTLPRPRVAVPTPRHVAPSRPARHIVRRPRGGRPTPQPLMVPKFRRAVPARPTRPMLRPHVLAPRPHVAVPTLRHTTPPRPPRPTPRPHIVAPRPHAPVSTPRHATPPHPPTRILPRPPHRPHRVLSPLERTALYAEARRQAPVAVEVIRPLARERPHPHARILRALRVQQQARPRPVPRARRIAVHVVVAPHIRVPAPPYYVRFAPIR